MLQVLRDEFALGGGRWVDELQCLEMESTYDCRWGRWWYAIDAPAADHVISRSLDFGINILSLVVFEFVVLVWPKVLSA